MDDEWLKYEIETCWTILPYSHSILCLDENEHFYGSCVNCEACVASTYIEHLPMNHMQHVVAASKPLATILL